MPTQSDIAYTEIDGAANATSSVYNKPADTAEGDLLILAHAVGGGETSFTWPTDFVAQGTFVSGSQLSGGVRAKLAGASEPATYTVSWAGSKKPGGWLIRVKNHGGTDLASALAGLFAQAVGTSPTSPSVSPTTSNALAIVGLIMRDANSGDNVITKPTGLDDYDSPASDIRSATTSGVVGKIVTKTLTASGATGSFTWGYNQNRNGLGFTMAVEGASGGSPVTGTAVDTAQAARSAGDGAATRGAVTEASQIAQAARSATAGSAIAGDATRAGGLAQAARRALDGVPAPGDASRVSDLATLIRSATAGSAIAGDASRTAELAQAARRAFAGIAIPGALSRASEIAQADRLVPGFSSSVAGQIGRAVIARLIRVAGDGAAILGDATRASELAQLARSATAGSAIAGDATRASELAQLVRQAEAGSAIVGSVSMAAAIASVIRQSTAGSAIPGDIAQAADQATIIRRAFDGEVIAGLLEVAQIAIIRRQVTGSSAPILGDVTELSELARVVRQASAGAGIPGDSIRGALIAEITRLVSGFSLAETSLAIGSLIARIERVVPGASAPVLGAIVAQSADPVQLERLAGFASAIAGDISSSSDIAELIRRSFGGSRGILGTLIEPADVFTLTVRERGVLMLAPIRGINISVHERGAIMTIPAKKITDFVFEREQTTNTKIPWSFDWASRLAEYGATSIASGTVAADPSTGLTLGAVQVSGLITSFECEALTAGEYDVRVVATFGVAPYTDAVHMRLRVRDVPRI